MALNATGSSHLNAPLTAEWWQRNAGWLGLDASQADEAVLSLTLTSDDVDKVIRALSTAIGARQFEILRAAG